MEPGDYPTNVLSFNNFASINYEYFEPQTHSAGTARKQLQKLEAGWRKDGRLVHCDPGRDGIWVFQTLLGTPSSTIGHSSLGFIENHGVKLLAREKGTYEPAHLPRIGQAGANPLGTPSSNLPPSSSLESPARTAQAINARAIHTNASQGAAYESPTPSLGLQSGIQNSPSQKHIHEHFISAVLGSIVYFLCRDHGFMPLNSRTLILTSPVVSTSSTGPDKPFHKCNEITLSSLDISLTSLGSLVVKAYSDTAPGLQSLVGISSPASPSDKLVSGTALWLAPGGTAAKFYGISDDRTLPRDSQVQMNATQNRPNGINDITITSWQSKCLDWLSTKGLDAGFLESGGWLFVQVLGGQPPYLNIDDQGISMPDDLAVLPWPALLCFQTSHSVTRDVPDENVSITGSRDPLSFAEHWFTSKDERASVILKRQKERQAAEALSREKDDAEARALQSNTYSPTPLRRASNAGAMYPTPPDAVQNPVGAIPSFDGTVSTPGNPNMFPMNDTGNSISSNPAIPDIDAEMWGSSEKKDLIGSNSNFNDNDIDNDNDDNLFGDIGGGDIFGTDITDADFSFFDEPDLPMTLDENPNTSSPVILSTPQEFTNLGNDFVLNETSSKPSPDIDMHDQVLSERVGNGEFPVETSHGGDLDSKIRSAVVEITNLETISEPSPQPSISPLFDKEAVFKRIFQGREPDTGCNQPRLASSFNKVNFEKSLMSVNEKYGVHGQFSFPPRRESQIFGPSELPKTKYLSSRRKTHDDQPQANTMTYIFQESIFSPVKEVDPMDYLMDSDGVSQNSEQDDTSHTTDEPSFASRFALGNWQLESEDGNEMTSPFDAFAMELEPEGTPQSINDPQLPLLDADPADWSLTNYLTSPEPEVQSNVLSDLEYIATAQILADQAVSGTLRLPGNSGDETPTKSKLSRTKELMHSLTKAADVCLKATTSCTMRSFLDIQGTPVVSQTLRLPARPIPPPKGSSMDATKSNNIFPIPPPQLELRRADSKLSILPSAVSFWGNLGLGPSRGPKDINAVCIYPNIEGVAENANTLLDQMRSTYESSRLGNHDRVNFKDLLGGLLPFSIDSSHHNNDHHLAALRETTGRLSKTLASLPADEKNFVVYFVYPIENATLLVHICSAFQHLFNLYRKALLDRKAKTANELVLQLIPLDCISSSTSLVVQTPAERNRLAMEVYDRCVDFNSSSSSPAIMLEQPLPKSIEFKLAPNPSASLLQENTCLHIAYAQSIDDRWITAAWTDNRGTQQMTASYCLGRKNEAISVPFSDIANEIWETTLDFISNKKIHWRIMIARVGVMDLSETEFWIGLAATESGAQVSLTLITVQTDPSLRLLPKGLSLSLNGNSTQSVITPVSTPQPSQSSVISPENGSTPTRDNSNAAATPGETPLEPDTDARLIDYTDQSWGAVLSHRLNNSNSLLDLNPALISGYLIKRGGKGIDDPPIVIEVNVVYSEVVGNPRTFHDTLLREILGYYRGLGTLARVRGVVDVVRDARPWHIAAVEKAVKALYMLM